MSSFITAQHLKVILGQESPVGKAWTDYYGPQVLARGMMVLPFAIEQFYPQTAASEWELAVIRMVISCSDLRDGPIACFEPQDFANRFHLSLRQIRRKFKTMVEKGLIIITPLYGEQGSKSTSRLYDCNPFLDKIFASVCTDDDWQRQQDELLGEIGIDEDIDDLDMLPEGDEYLASSAYQFTSVQAATEWTSMSPAPTISSGSSMSPAPTISSRSSMSPAQMGSGRTSVSPQGVAQLAAPPTSYALAHTHTPDSNSNSNTNINTCINKLDINSNSNSNSNSNRARDNSDPADLSTAEDINFQLQTTSVSMPHVDDDVRMPCGDTLFVPASKEQAVEQAEAASEHLQQQEQIQHQALELPADKPTGHLLAIVKAEPIEPDDHAWTAEPSAPIPTADEQEMPVMLQGHAKTALYHISNALHDASPHSSRARARTLYNQLLVINQIEDEYTLSDPDMYFSDLMRNVKYALRNKTFKSRNYDGQPNGMPLFFYELKKRIEDQIATVAEMRKEGIYQNMYYERRRNASMQDNGEGVHDTSEGVTSEFMREQKAAKETAQLIFTNLEIVAHLRRLQLPLSDEEAESVLDGSASERLLEELTTAVRLGLYYEILDK